MQWISRRHRWPIGNPRTPIRVRLTMLATAMVTLAFTLAAAALVFAIDVVSTHSVDAATSARAAQIADDLRAEPITGLDHYLLEPARNVDVIQVLAADGHIVATSRPGARVPLATPTATDRRTDSEYRTTTLATVTRDGEPVTVVVGAAERPIHRIVGATAVLCCIVFPPVVLGMAFLTYYLAGRTLAVVGHLERQVARISADDLHQRLPVPATGDEIAALATTMNGMLDRIDRSHSRQALFVSDASHQLTEPVAALVDDLEGAQRDHRAIAATTISERLLPEARRMTTTTAGLLRMARTDDGNPPVGQDH